MRRTKRALLEQYIVPGPSPPPSYVDDYQLIQQLDEFAADQTGFEEWIRMLAAEDRERARSILLTVKFKYPDLHRVFLKQRGRNTTDSNLTDLLDRQQPGTVPEDLEEVDEPEQMTVPDSEVTEILVVETPLPETQERPTHKDEYDVELEENETTYVPEEENNMRGREEEGESRRRRSRSLRRSRDRRSMERGEGEDKERGYMKNYRRKRDEEEDRPRSRRRRSIETSMEHEALEEEAMEERPSRRSRRRREYWDPTEAARTRARTRRQAAEDEYDMMELDDLEEVSDEDIEELDECPVGCVPVSDEEMDEEMEDMEEEAEGMEEEAEGMEEEDDEEEMKEAASADDSTTEAEAEVKEADVEVEAETVFEPLAVMADLEQLDFSAGENQIDMLLVGTEEDPRYLVVVNGSPVAAIHANSLDLPAEQRGMFFDEDYPKWVMQGIETIGIAKTLDSLNAKYFAAKALEGDVFKAASEKVAADQDEERLMKLATLKDNLLSHVAIIIEGSLKNYWQDNPLKDALLSEFRKSGVENDAMVHHIEAAFRQGGTEYFDFVMKTAAEWLGKPREIIEHYISEISASNYRFPQLDEEYDDEITEAPMAAFAEATPEGDTLPRNVPLRTVGQQHHASSRTFDTDTARRALMGSVAAKAGHKLPPK
jgi:hypothetical protein